MLRTLISLNDPTLLPTLRERLLKDDSWKVRGGCVIVLANIRTDESTEALIGFVHDSVKVLMADKATQKKVGFRTSVDVQMAGGGVNCAAETIVARGKFDAVRNDLAQLGMVDLLARCGRGGVEELIALGRRAETPAGLPKGVHAENIAKALRGINDPAASESLREAAADAALDPEIRAAAIAALAGLRSAEEFEFFVRLARAPKQHPEVLLAAYAAAARGKPAEVRDEVFALSNSPSTMLRTGALRILGTAYGAAARERLIAALDDEDDGAQFAALTSLWMLEHVRREVRWRNPRTEKEYEAFIKTHPVPEHREE